MKNYSEVPYRQNSEGEVMRECNSCGYKAHMFFHGGRYYQVGCEKCEEVHDIEASSLDEAMEIWKKMQLIAECDYCPLGWEEKGYEGECYDYGCMTHSDKTPRIGENWCEKTYSERREKSKEYVSI